MAVAADAAAPTAAAADEQRISSPRSGSSMWWRFRKHRVAVASAIVVARLLSGRAGRRLPRLLRPQRLGGAARVDAAAADPLVRRGAVSPARLRPDGARDPQTFKRVYRAGSRRRRFRSGFFARGFEYQLSRPDPDDAPSDRRRPGLDAAKTIFLLGTDVQGRDLWSRLMYGTRDLADDRPGRRDGEPRAGRRPRRALRLLRRRRRHRHPARHRDPPLDPDDPAVDGAGGGAAARTGRSCRSISPSPSSSRSSAGPSWRGSCAGRFLALREEDFVMAAPAGRAAARCGSIFVHMVPSFMSHIIAATTLALPAMIISETALSFLGLGLRPPAISWGVLLQQAQNVQTVAISPWLLLAGRPGHRRRPGLQLPGRRTARRRRSRMDDRRRPDASAACRRARSEDSLLPGRGHGEGGRRRQPRPVPAGDARHRRRERLRQERHRPLDLADRRPARPDRRRRDPVSRPRARRPHGRPDGRSREARRRTARRCARSAGRRSR